MEEEKGIQDYIPVFKRHKFKMILTALVIFLIAVILAIKLPSVYKSTGTILIEQQEIPQDLVRSTVTSYADQRIQVISQRVMSTKNLKQVVDKFNLYTEERKTETLAEILDTMREDIQLEMVSADVVDPVTGRPVQATIAFTLSYSSESPKLAQKVANELVSLYLNENLKYRTRAATETSEFLKIEAEKLAERISEVEADLAEFKKNNSANLPELQEMNMRMLDRTEQQIDNTDRQINSLAEKKLYLNAELMQISPNTMSYSATGAAIYSSADRLKALQAEYIALTAKYASTHPDVIKMQSEISALEKEVGGVDKLEIQVQLKNKKAELASLRKRYSAEHPDVQKLTKEITYLQAELTKPVAKKKVYDTKPDNPVYIQLQAQLQAVSADLNALTKSRTRLEVKLGKYEAGLLKSPQVEREYRTLTRNYDNARLKFREIKAKQMEADIAQTMEKGRKGERFTLVEPPLFPEEPIKPNRLAIILLGFILSIAAALGLGFVKASVDHGIYTANQLRAVTDSLPLIVIPFIETDEDLQKKNKFKYQLLFAIFAILLSSLIIVHLFFIPLDVLWHIVLRKLDLNSV